MRKTLLILVVSMTFLVCNPTLGQDLSYGSTEHSSEFTSRVVSKVELDDPSQLLSSDKSCAILASGMLIDCIINFAATGDLESEGLSDLIDAFIIQDSVYVGRSANDLNTFDSFFYDSDTQMLIHITWDSVTGLISYKRKRVTSGIIQKVHHVKWQDFNDYLEVFARAFTEN